MKVAVSTQGRDLSSSLHSGFGRAPGFIIYDLETEEYTYLSNEHNLSGAKGVGARTAQDVVNCGVQGVVTSQMGPKAFSFLRGQKVQIYLTEAETVQEAIQAWRQGDLKPRQSLVQ